jgi:glucose/arabinose dehydrogenase
MGGLGLTRPFVMIFACLALLLTACDKSTAGGVGTPTLTATPAPTATATIPPTGNLATVKLSLTPVARGLMRPDFLTTAPDGTGRLYITQQSGEIRVAEANGKLYSEPFLNVETRWDAELGLMGLAFDPQYKKNGFFYISYSTLEGDTRIARYHVDDDNPLRADPDSGQTILLIQQPRPVRPEHKSGMLLFGPDGYLYIGVGDGGLGYGANGQKLDTILGKILRIDVEHTSPGKAYAIPPTNPFVSKQGVAPEIWAYGVRNPWRFSFDRLTRNLYIGDVGELTNEEVDFQPATSKGGENYGWSQFEGPQCMASNCTQLASYSGPITSYHHGGDVCAIAGGYVYRGKPSPALQGIYVYGDWCSGRIWGLNTDDNAPGKPAQVRLLLDTDLSLSAFGEDDAGEVYALDLHTGIAYRLTAK